MAALRLDSGPGAEAHVLGRENLVDRDFTGQRQSREIACASTIRTALVHNTTLSGIGASVLAALLYSFHVGEQTLVLPAREPWEAEMIPNRPELYSQRGCRSATTLPALGAETFLNTSARRQPDD